MTTSIKLFVSILFVSIGLFSAGCQTRVLGMNLKSGYVDRSDVMVRNSYPYLTMRVQMQTIWYPAWAHRGDGRNPITGALPTPMFGILSREYASLVKGQDIRAESHTLVLEKEDLLVMVTWYDQDARAVGKASVILRPWCGDNSWHYDVRPRMGEFGRTRFGDQITYWQQ